MNRYEWRTKWEWVAVVLLVTLVLALCMHS